MKNTALEKLKDLTLHLMIALLFLYGIWSCLFSAYDLGVTFDELIYRSWGGDFFQSKVLRFFDHPPLSIWLGAVIPKVFGEGEAFFYRLANISIYFAGGVLLAAILYLRANLWSCLVFSVLYFLDPNLKAMAALHVTDSPVTVFIALTAVSLWVFAETEKNLWFFVAVLFWSLAISTKMTPLLFFPFLVWVYFQKARLKEFPKDLFLSILVYGFVAYFAYLANGNFLLSQWKTFQFARMFSEVGHATALFRQHTTDGYLYYFLVYFLVKTPLLVIAVFVVGFRLQKKFSLLTKAEKTIFFWPVLLLLLVLSTSKMQVGYRYFHWGILLSYILLGLVIGRAVEKTGWLKPAVLLTAVLLFLEDANTLRVGSYLTYFNPLGIESTRNFADSNIDWHQGLPKHLEEKVGRVWTTDELFEFFAGAEDSATFVVGANALAGFWGSTLDMHLRSFSPKKIIAGYELINLNKNDLFLLLSKRAPLLPRSWKPNYLYHIERSVRELDPFSKKCMASQRLISKSQQVSLQGLRLEKMKQVGLKLVGQLPWPKGISKFDDVLVYFRNPFGGDLWLNGVQVTEHVGPSHPFEISDFWRRIIPVTELLPIELQYSNGAAGIESRLPNSMQMMFLWQECV